MRSGIVTMLYLYETSFVDICRSSFNYFWGIIFMDDEPEEEQELVRASFAMER